MPDQTEQLERRDMLIRAVDTDARTITGIAVPYDTPTTIRSWFGNYTETIARGAVQDSGDALLFWRHDEPIGRITQERDTDEGWEITARISTTPRGDEAYTLARDGVIDRMSIGFEPVTTETDEETGDVTRTAIRVREVSLVPFPAYDGATVTDVRHRQPAPPTDQPQSQSREDQHMTDVITSADLESVRTSITDLERGLDQRLANLAPSAPAVDTRSAGEVLQALVRGDEATIAAYDQMQRAFDGTVVADGWAQPQWVGDLTRIIADSSILPGLFSTGTLPSTGNTLEFGRLKSNTVTVEQQVNEGDELARGKVTLETDNATVKTFGGYSTLSRQAIERSQAPLLTRTLEALAKAAARRRNISLRAFLATVRAGQVAADTPTARTTVTVADEDTYLDWVSGIVDAAGIYEDLALPLEGLLTDKDTFKALAGLHDSTGRPLVTVYGSGDNVVGEVNVKNISGNLAGVTVRVDPRQAERGASFYNGEAIRQYNSPLVSLTDGNVVNLTNAYSVYFYAALADEVPGAIVPVVAADPTSAGA